MRACMSCTTTKYWVVFSGVHGYEIMLYTVGTCLYEQSACAQQYYCIVSYRRAHNHLHSSTLAVACILHTLIAVLQQTQSTRTRMHTCTQHSITQVSALSQHAHSSSEWDNLSQYNIHVHCCISCSFHSHCATLLLPLQLFPPLVFVVDIAVYI
jgi:hypothetical protein